MQSIIINSCEEAVKDLEPIKDTVDIEAFPSVDENVIKSLAKAITFLLSYKVSREAHQRYSVRTQIIVSSKSCIFEQNKVPLFIAMFL